MMTRPTADATGSPECECVRLQAFAACDGELSAAELAAVNEHLAECASCRERFIADATFHAVVRKAVALETAPQSLRDRIQLALTTRTTANAPA